MSEADWRAAGDRVEALIAASAAGGTVARERAEELVRLVADLYGAGLTRLLDIAHEHGALTDDVLDALAGDDLVASLLLVHGLHPYPVESRIEQALADLGARGDGVELLGVGADGVVRLRMPGGDGCGSAAARLAVEAAIEAAAPEVTAIEVEEPAAPAGGSVIPVSALFSRIAPVAS
ncbi:hypothetical protein ACIBSW_16335 [Actinoplanes sp. NPDC049668]|uniref:hypothetical protein n=1 Tax=unclassified Actinoplanes TaxID=2626549 RepID=UPI0033B0DC59